MLSSLLEDKTAQHSQVISLLTRSSVTSHDEVEAAQIFAKVLQQATTYNVLIIKNKAGENLFSYKNTDIGLTLPFTSPKPKKEITEQFGITIEYQLNFLGEYTLVIGFILFSIVLSFSLVIFATTMSTKRHKNNI